MLTLRRTPILPRLACASLSQGGEQTQAVRPMWGYAQDLAAHESAFSMPYLRKERAGQGRGGADLAVRPIWPRHTKRIMSQKGRLAEGARLLSGSDGLMRLPACASCRTAHTRGDHSLQKPRLASIDQW